MAKRQYFKAKKVEVNLEKTLLREKRKIEPWGIFTLNNRESMKNPRRRERKYNLK